jgi:hypothetical protein
MVKTPQRYFIKPLPREAPAKHEKGFEESRAKDSSERLGS